MGIQSVFSSVPEPVASSKSVSEAAYFVQRSGARSIIALGNGALCDLATSVRKSIERGAAAVESGIDTTAPGKALSVLTVPTNASPSYFYDTALLLNSARDVFSAILVRPPEVIYVAPAKKHILTSLTYFYHILLGGFI
jgi:alcohol dehydrogenase class IV